MAASQSEHHLVPLKVYLLIFFCLLVGTALTVAAAHVEMGWLNTPVALAIAIFKASLVLLFFMHVKYSDRMVWVFSGAGFFWLLLLLVLTMQDYMSRGWDSPPAAAFLETSSGVF